MPCAPRTATAAASRYAMHPPPAPLGSTRDLRWSHRARAHDTSVGLRELHDWIAAAVRCCAGALGAPGRAVCGHTCAAHGDSACHASIVAPSIPWRQASVVRSVAAIAPTTIRDPRNEKREREQASRRSFSVSVLCRFLLVGSKALQSYALTYLH